MTHFDTQAQDFEWERLESGWKITRYTGSDPQIEIPSELDSLPVVLIGANAFEGCRFITRIVVPDSVGFISNYAFWNCSGLISARLPEGIEVLNLGTFLGCSSLQHITLPSSVKSIGDGAFKGCTSLVSCKMAFGVETIGDSAFRDCTSLEAVELPATVTSITRSAFRDCTSLRFVSVHDTITYVGPRAFQGCPSLDRVLIVGEDVDDTVTAFRNHSLTYLVTDYVIDRRLLSFDEAKRLLTSKFAPEILLGARVITTCFPERLAEIPTKLALTLSLSAAGRTEELKDCEGRPGYLSKPSIMKCIDAAHAQGHVETVAYLVKLASQFEPLTPTQKITASGLEL